MQTGPVAAERRCPDCGALAASDAEWCGQCLRSLAEPLSVDPVPELEPVSEPAGGLRNTAQTPAAAEPEGPTTPATWPCPTCGNANPLALDACAVCGTTFASLMRQDEAPPRIDPKEALSASLLFPGLGHRKIGRGLDGLARGVLFVVLVSMAGTVFFAGVSSTATFGVFALFLGSALAVYLGTAWEAFHMAGGGGALVSSRALLWATVAVIMASVLMLAMSVVTVTRR